MSSSSSSNSKTASFGSEEHWRCVDRAASTFSVDHLKWLLRTVAADAAGNAAADAAGNKTFKSDLRRIDARKLEALWPEDIFRVGQGQSNNSIEKTTTTAPIPVQQRSGGAATSQSLCTSINATNATNGILHVLTLNCWFLQDGGNLSPIVNTVLRLSPTCVCLQEVTTTLFASLARSDALRDAGYALFGRMDQEYITLGRKGAKGNESGINYGLAFLTKVPLEDYQSIPFTQGERYDSSSAAFRAAADAAARSHSQPGEDENMALLKGSSAALSPTMPLTTQGRYFDVAIASDFVVVNLHAESLQASVVRDKQFRIIVEHLRRVNLEGKTTLLVGDLNTAVGSSEERVLRENFWDTLGSREPRNTFLLTKKRKDKILYYDRVLVFKGKEGKEGNGSGGAEEWMCENLNVAGVPVSFDHAAVHVKVKV